MNKPYREEYDASGYAIVSAFFRHDEIERITAIVDRIYAQWRQQHQELVVKQQLINMSGLTHPQYFQTASHERITVFELMAPQKLTVLLDDLFGADLYFLNSQLFFNPDDPGKRPYWHRDLQYSPIDDATQAREQTKMLTLHVRIPLIPEKGIELIPQTHQRWDTPLEREVRFELKGHANHEELPGAVLIELSPGDILIFNAQLIHRGNYALNPDRQALDLCIGKPHPLISSFLDPDHLPTDEEIEHIPNAHWYQCAKKVIASQHR